MEAHIVPEKVEETHDEPWSLLRSRFGRSAEERNRQEIVPTEERKLRLGLDSDNERVSLAVPVFAFCPHT